MTSLLLTKDQLSVPPTDIIESTWTYMCAWGRNCPESKAIVSFSHPITKKSSGNYPLREEIIIGTEQVMFWGGIHCSKMGFWDSFSAKDLMRCHGGNTPYRERQILLTVYVEVLHALAERQFLRRQRGNEFEFMWFLRNAIIKIAEHAALARRIEAVNHAVPSSAMNPTRLRGQK